MEILLTEGTSKQLAHNFTRVVQHRIIRRTPSIPATYKRLVLNKERDHSTKSHSIGEATLIPIAEQMDSCMRSVDVMSYQLGLREVTTLATGKYKVIALTQT